MTKSGLGPHVVGQRVVVRRLVPGETGPTGGPAFTDVLGTCESWTAEETVIRTADGDEVRIPIALIVSGKPVPPRPSRFRRLSDDEVEARAAGLFVPAETARIGDWVLRFTESPQIRPRSLLPLGDPGLPLDEALAQVSAFYGRHGHNPAAQVVVGSALADELVRRGWTGSGDGEADGEVHLAGVAQVGRALAGVEPGPGLVHTDRISRDWLVGNDAALENYPAVAASLDLDRVTFAAIHDADGRQLVRGRVNVVDDWALVADLTVRPDVRRRGWARRMMAALTSWAAEEGASVLLLQVLADNDPAQRLYADLGFERHHAYRHLQAPTEVRAR